MSAPPRWRLLALATALGLAGAAGRAETLRDALAAAYRSNPDLTGSRAGLRVLDEDVAEALAAGRPGVTATADVVQDFDALHDFRNDGRLLDSTVGVQYRLYQGGRARNAVRAADRRVAAGRFDLNGVENQIFLDVVSAYMDVLLADAVVSLNVNQVRVLEQQLQASRDRFEVGDLTRTDVAQSEARLAGARASLTSARADLTGRREAYRRVVGVAPRELEAPPPLPPLPGTAADAIRAAIDENPELEAARASENAFSFDVAAARADRLPRVTANTGVRYQSYLGSLGDDLGLPDGAAGSGVTLDNDDLSQEVGLALTLPLYQSGAVSARIRRLQAQRSQALERLVATERTVVNDARVAFEQLVAAQEVIRSAQVAVSANELALEGTRAENLVGARNILQVLDAEQELLNARVQLVTARRNAYVAGFALLAVIGRADADHLNLDVPRYDPDAHHRRVRRIASDWRTGDAPAEVATRTAAQAIAEPADLPGPAVPPSRPTGIDPLTRFPERPAPEPSPLLDQPVSPTLPLDSPGAGSVPGTPRALAPAPGERDPPAIGPEAPGPRARPLPRPPGPAVPSAPLDPATPSPSGGQKP